MPCIIGSQALCNAAMPLYLRKASIQNLQVLAVVLSARHAATREATRYRRSAAQMRASAVILVAVKAMKQRKRLMQNVFKGPGVDIHVDRKAVEGVR